MASYAELVQASTDNELLKRVRVACVVAAEVIRNNATATDVEKAWARRAFHNPEERMREVLWAVLAQNRSYPLSTIIGADDATVQTAVNAALPLIIS
jgi:propanediol dehydratase large subunit